MTTVNVAAITRATADLGPGRRAAVWVQGCPFNCPGCIAPEWIPDRPAIPMLPADLAASLLADPEVRGLTFSGGEPMAQAAGLARTAVLARAARELTLICFTGYRLERLRSHPPGPGIAELLAEVDVLIDGRYVTALDDGRGLRGSANQRIHYLSDRIQPDEYDFMNRPRTAEVVISGSELTIIGIPPAGLLRSIDMATEHVRQGSLS
jgi:anaerobic ribonucleoside-triphosphate reductase activating protein